MALEELSLSFGGQRGEAQKVSHVDAGKRPVHVLAHAAILPAKQAGRDAETSDMRQMRVMNRSA
jgi:hypothetical protein